MALAISSVDKPSPNNSDTLTYTRFGEGGFGAGGFDPGSVGAADFSGTVSASGASSRTISGSSSLTMKR